MDYCTIAATQVLVVVWGVHYVWSASKKHCQMLSDDLEIMWKRMKITAKAQPLYTNGVSQEFLSNLDTVPFTEQQLAELADASLTRLYRQRAYCEAHPPVAIYRLATEGSQTRNGGTIQRATTDMQVVLDNGQYVRIAQVGDIAVYADGSVAQIVTGAGHCNGHLAVVGSHLSNGDEIINTQQSSCVFVARADEPLGEDFLPPL